MPQINNCGENVLNKKDVRISRHGDVPAYQKVLFFLDWSLASLGTLRRAVLSAPLENRMPIQKRLFRPHRELPPKASPIWMLIHMNLPKLKVPSCHLASSKPHKALANRKKKPQTRNSHFNNERKAQRFKAFPVGNKWMPNWMKQQTVVCSCTYKPGSQTTV